MLSQARVKQLKKLNKEISLGVEFYSAEFDKVADFYLQHGKIQYVTFGSFNLYNYDDSIRDRANIEAILKTYPEIVTQVYIQGADRLFFDLSGSNFKTIIEDVIYPLSEYPILDDSIYYALEHEETFESWLSFGHDEFMKFLQKNKVIL
jgi:hypothetical protein